ncbi:MAG: hypothetical protein BWK79_09790 [Beggiatoa sp. IS2]|nr:MAG: hypothetical protein BWK79_09790 [Beggiatoa sp. IS2]
MGWLRSVVWVALGWVLWKVSNKLYQDIQRTESEIPASSQPPLKQGGEMVRCGYCELHIPKQEAICMDEQIFCCEEHRQAAKNLSKS